MNGIGLDWQQPLWLLALPLVLWWAWATLRASRPRPAGAAFGWLLGLRLLAWILLVALLARPRLSWEERREEAPVLAVLLDESASLPFLGGRTEHGDWLPALARALDDVELRVYAFGDTLRELASLDDSPSGTAPATDLDGAFAELERRLGGGHWTGALLVGDGNPTAGPWPVERVRRLDARVWTAGTGRRVAPPDLVLRALDANPRVPAGRSQPVEIELDGRGLAGRAARVALSVDGREVAAASVELPEDGGRLRVPLEWTPARPGLAVLAAEATLVGGADGEASLANNRRLAHVQVRAGRRPALLLAGGPSADLALLRRAFEAQEELETGFALPERPGADRAAIRAEVEKAELLLLVGWPTRGSDPELVRAVRERLGRVPTLVAEGAGARLEELGGLPLQAAPLRPTPLAAGPRALAVHPVLGEESSLDELQALWRELPPVTATRPEARPRDGARVLLAGEGGEPLLALAESGGRRQAQLAAQGAWRWGPGSQLSLGANRRAELWAGALLRWLLAPPGARLFEVEAEEAVLPAGSAPVFRARLAAEDGRPLDGARVEVELRADTAGAAPRRLVLAGEGEGRYAGRGPALAAGAWRWTAAARSGDGAVLADSGRLSAEAFSPEWLAPVRGERLLAELAAAGGGSMLDLDDDSSRAALAAGEPFAGLERRPRIVVRGRSREALDGAALLVALLGLLGVDWLLRRLRGML